MKIGIASTGRSLSENVYKRFANSPAFLIYDTESGSLRAINNFSKYGEGCGVQAAHILKDNKVDAAIVGDIDGTSLKILKTNNVLLYNGYPGTGKESLKKLKENKLEKITFSSNSEKETISEDPNESIRKIKSFCFLNLEATFNKEFVPFEDWCMILNHPVAGKVPVNWISPSNFSDGVYYLKLEVLEMNQTKIPVEFEFGWCNFPEEKHANIPHRCNFGIYSSFTSAGIYEHIARIKDTENTSVDSREEPWDWEAGWDSPFSLIKPYGQDPFPISVKFSVWMYSS